MRMRAGVSCAVRMPVVSAAEWIDAVCSMLNVLRVRQSSQACFEASKHIPSRQAPHIWKESAGRLKGGMPAWSVPYAAAVQWGASNQPGLHMRKNWERSTREWWSGPLGRIELHYRDTAPRCLVAPACLPDKGAHVVSTNQGLWQKHDWKITDRIAGPKKNNDRFSSPAYLVRHSQYCIFHYSGVAHCPAPTVYKGGTQI